ncbi:hypothetical protein CXB51_010917 [Gossypium anomalum]|uniref:Uncharacterized protein n=1 Tax=Gossypium anomalum TaxID=47600 RepID=A0A8J5ZDT4_9ROSI|nr:hypothetical protein CXB51_010917 [Gossypium anomalum]
MDWWPIEKCDCNQCPQGKVGLLDLDLKKNALINAIKCEYLMISSWICRRVKNCLCFKKSAEISFGFSKGNGLYGVKISAKVKAKQYEKDVIILKNLVKELYPEPETQPEILGPGGDDPNLITKTQESFYLNQAIQTYKDFDSWVSESGGAFHVGGKDVSPTLANVFGKCSFLSFPLAINFKDGEYFNQLGMASAYNHKGFCRQALIREIRLSLILQLLYTNILPFLSLVFPQLLTCHLLSLASCSALLWHRIMGSIVLPVTQN